MKKKQLLFLIPMLLLASCGDKTSNSQSAPTPTVDKISLDELTNLLETTYITKEIANSNKVVFEETDQRGEGRIYNTKETFTIFNDETSVAIGEEKYEYLQSGEMKEVSDSYQTLITTKTYNEQKVFYRVTDFDNGTLNANWTDSAYRLPVVESGSASENGSSYLLQKSVPGQLSKQVSLISRNFIAGYLSSNPDVMLGVPSANVTKQEDKTIYSVKNFTYSYGDDDGSNTEVLIEFELITNETDGLLESKTIYQTTTTRDDESYVENLTSHYTISYGERSNSSTFSNLINPEDYFLQEVDEVKAYVYSNGYKEYVNTNNLPLNAYVHFEASIYSPSKAVNLEMAPVSSSDKTVVSVSGNVFETLKAGESTLVLESATGVKKEVNVRVNIPSVLSINYVDTYSDIEKGYDENSNPVRYIYTDTTYTNINISPRPSSALVEDIEIVISDETVLEITIDEEKSNANLLSLQYNVLKNNDEEKVSVTFKSKIDETISYTVTYFIKNRLSHEQLIEKLTTHTYKWTNLYDAGYSVMKIKNDHEGEITYYKDNEVLGDASFTYSIKDTKFSIVMSKYYGLYKYNDGEITLDGEKIVLSVNVTDYMHHYEIQNGGSL